MSKAIKTRKKRSGAAALEAVILLPVFLLIFTGVLYIEMLWENQQQALLQARRCAWLYANAGCVEDVLQKDCIDILRSAAGLTEGNTLAENMKGGVLDGLCEVPIIGPVIEGLFANAFYARSTRHVQQTPLLGEKTVAVVGSYYLMCNEKKRDTLDLIKDAFYSTIGSAPGGPQKPSNRYAR